jgi:hypothetical protein
VHETSGEAHPRATRWPHPVWRRGHREFARGWGARGHGSRRTGSRISGPRGMVRPCDRPHGEVPGLASRSRLLGDRDGTGLRCRGVPQPQSQGRRWRSRPMTAACSSATAAHRSPQGCPRERADAPRRRWHHQARRVSPVPPHRGGVHAGGRRRHRMNPTTEPGRPTAARRSGTLVHVSTTRAASITRQGTRCTSRSKHASEPSRRCRSHERASTLVSGHNYARRVGGSRFLETDPVEGGSANDYDYVSGDPINQFDLDGQICFSCAVRTVKNVVKRGAHIARKVSNAGLTVAGVGWAYMNGGSCRLRKGLMVACTGMRWGYGFRGGFTVGNTYMTKARRVTDSRMRHEAAHASQWAVLGGAMPLSYAADWLAARGNPCRQVMERQAGLASGGYRC